MAVVTTDLLIMLLQRPRRPNNNKRELPEDETGDTLFPCVAASLLLMQPSLARSADDLGFHIGIRECFRFGVKPFGLEFNTLPSLHRLVGG